MSKFHLMNKTRKRQRYISYNNEYQIILKFTELVERTLEKLSVKHATDPLKFQLHIYQSNEYITENKKKSTFLFL